jgi:hypothetical protein
LVPLLQHIDFLSEFQAVDGDWIGSGGLETTWQMVIIYGMKAFENLPDRLRCKG